MIRETFLSETNGWPIDGAGSESFSLGARMGIWRRDGKTAGSGDSLTFMPSSHHSAIDRPVDRPTSNKYSLMIAGLSVGYRAGPKLRSLWQYANEVFSRWRALSLGVTMQSSYNDDRSCQVWVEMCHQNDTTIPRYMNDNSSQTLLSHRATIQTVTNFKICSNFTILQPYTNSEMLRVYINKAKSNSQRHR